MSEYETIKEYEHEGWHISVALAPDYDYEAGRDDEIYPRFESLPQYADRDELERPRDYDGRFLPGAIVVDSRSGPVMVTADEITRLIEIGGGNPRRMRKWIAETAAAIAGEHLSWVVIRVTASRGDISGSDYLGGVEYDLRERDPDAYALEAVKEYGMAENAIHDAARNAVGNLATQALSY